MHTVQNTVLLGNAVSAVIMQIPLNAYPIKKGGGGGDCYYLVEQVLLLCC